MAQGDDWDQAAPAPERGPGRVSPAERILLLAFSGLVAVVGLLVLAASGAGSLRLAVGLPVGLIGVGLFILALREPNPVADGDLSAVAVLRIERWALTPPALAALFASALVFSDSSLVLPARLVVGSTSLVLFVALGLLVTRAQPRPKVPRRAARPLGSPGRARTGPPRPRSRFEVP